MKHKLSLIPERNPYIIWETNQLLGIINELREQQRKITHWTLLKKEVKQICIYIQYIWNINSFYNEEWIRRMCEK
jgi:hypothetical protein